jgi:hypothetical protein
MDLKTRNFIENWHGQQEGGHCKAAKSKPRAAWHPSRRLSYSADGLISSRLRCNRSIRRGEVHYFPVGAANSVTAADLVALCRTRIFELGVWLREGLTLRHCKYP